MARRTRHARPGGALVALSAACGLTVGMRSVVALDGWGVRSLLTLPELPVEPLGLAWSHHARWPVELQAAAVERMAGLLAALFLAALAVALLNTLVLLLESGAAGWREVAVRAAVGAGPFRLVGQLLADVRRLVGVGVALGLLLGLATGAALRGAWPGVLSDPGLLPATAFLVPTLGACAAAAALAHAAVGFRTLRPDALAPALASGERATSGRGAVFLRRMLSAGQAGTAGALLLGSLALVLALDGPTGEMEGDLLLVPVTAPAGAPSGHWANLLERLHDIPGVEAESLATPGALLGLGVRDHAVAECGRCSAGGLPLPFRGAMVHHHAVTPGYVAAAGLEVVAGRPLGPGDVEGARPVALVNRTFASTAFERGDPLGRKVRLGTGLDTWYTVVGVVSDLDVPVMGGDDGRRPAIYLSAFQREPRSGHLLFRGGNGSERAVTGLLAREGYAPGEPRSLETHRRAAAAPLGWMRLVALLVGGVTLLLALHGAHETALQVVRRQTRELAVRRVLGASDRRIVGHVLGGAGRVGAGAAAFTLFFGALLVALLRKAAAGVAPLGPATYLAVAGLLVAAATWAALRATREALAVEPGRALAGTGRRPTEPRRGSPGS